MRPAVAKPHGASRPRPPRRSNPKRERARWTFGRVVHGLFLLADGGLLLLFLVGYAAAYLHPGRFWWAALIGIWLPYLSMLAVLFTVPMVLLRRWRFVQLHLVLVALIALRFLSVEQFRTAPEGEAASLVLMTFNSPLTGPSADSLEMGMLRFVRREQPDVITVQESSVWLERTPLKVRAHRHIAALIDSLGYSTYVPKRVGWQNAIHQPVLEKSIEILEQSQTDLRAQASDEDRTYVVRTRFRWEGREAVLYNVHLRTYGRDKPWRAEMRIWSWDFWKPYLRMYRTNYRLRAEEIVRIRHMLDRETLPVIVCGDLNSTPHNWEYRTLSRDLLDAFKVAGRGWGGTWHARLPLVRIDHILVSKEWRVLKARVPSVFLSDHRPLVVKLAWRE